jgi:hypothetical protein
MSEICARSSAKRRTAHTLRATQKISVRQRGGVVFGDQAHHGLKVLGGDVYRAQMRVGRVVDLDFHSGSPVWGTSWTATLIPLSVPMTKLSRPSTLKRIVA